MEGREGVLERIGGEPLLADESLRARALFWEQPAHNLSPRRGWIGFVGAHRTVWPLG